MFSLVILQDAYGYDFGKRAMSFQVEEEGFIEMIKRKMKSVNWHEEEEKMIKMAKKQIKNPEAVNNITQASVSSVFWHDPSYVLKEDIFLPCGKLLHKSGTRVNPLDHMDLERRLFFIDSRIEEQIDWLKERLEDKLSDRIKNRVILVGGDVFGLEDELGMQIYFDQEGELTSKWGIKHSPALVYQEGKKLKIIEVAVE